jgi:hypothetical protein
MEGRKNFWSHLKGHSVMWTYAFVALVVLATLRQPSWQFVVGGALFAGCTGLVTALIRKNGFGRSFVVYLLGGTIGSLAFAGLALKFLLPVATVITVPLWNNILLVVVAALVILRITWVLAPHHHTTAASGTNGDGAAPAPVPVANPHKVRKVAVAATLGVLAFGWLFYANTSTLFVDWQLTQVFQPAPLQTMLKTINDRQLPRDTGFAAIAGGGTDSNVLTATPHLVPTSSGPDWQSPRYDRGPVGTFFCSVEDVVQVKANTTKSVLVNNPVPARFIYGDCSWVVQGVFAARHPFSTMGERVYTRLDDGSWMMLISVVSTRPTMFGTMVPYMVGVMAVTQDGQVSDLSVEEAGQTYANLPLYPLELMRRYASARAYLGGGWNDVAFFWSPAKHVSVIAEDTSSDPNANKAPYIMHTEKLGQQAMLATRPQGSDLTTEWLYWNVTTGEAHYYVPTRRLFAPSIAVPESRKAVPNMDRSHQRTVEPRPVVIDTADGGFKLFYEVAVVGDDPANPNTHSFVQSIVVNADDKSATAVGDDEFDNWEAKISTGK